MRLPHAASRVAALYQDFGLEPFRHRLARRVADRRGRGRIYTGADWQDILEAERRGYSAPAPRALGDRPVRLNWVLPGISLSGGGISTIARAVLGLEERGYDCEIYLASESHPRSLPEQAGDLRTIMPSLEATVAGTVDRMRPADAVVATAWETVYPVVRYRRDEEVGLYFVQDYEPYFFPRGSMYEFARRTYDFGLSGVTAGKWLEMKLARDHGMPTASFPLAVDTTQYPLRNRGARSGVVFYARPKTERRAFEVGVLALALLHSYRPDVQIHMVGEDLSGFVLPFPCHQHGVLTHSELSLVYNECAAGLVLSLTNGSLLPAELLASGCIPVSNDDPCARLVIENDHVEYAACSPRALADAIRAVVVAEDQAERAQHAAASVANRSWIESAAAIDAAISTALRCAAK